MRPEASNSSAGFTEQFVSLFEAAGLGRRAVPRAAVRNRFRSGNHLP